MEKISREEYLLNPIYWEIAMAFRDMPEEWCRLFVRMWFDMQERSKVKYHGLMIVGGNDELGK